MSRFSRSLRCVDFIHDGDVVSMPSSTIAESRVLPLWRSALNPATIRYGAGLADASSSAPVRGLPFVHSSFLRPLRSAPRLYAVCPSAQFSAYLSIFNSAALGTF